MEERAGSPARAAVGAAFLMATSAIGPGFLTQTAVFTDRLRTSFAFAILVSILVDLAVQVNVWCVLGVARKRGQEVANALVPGLGVVLALLVAPGGLVFNVGNVAGCGLGLAAAFGVPVWLGATLSAAFAAVLLARPAAGQKVDSFAKVLGGVMILLTATVMLATGPDYGAALRASVWPDRVEMLPILTIVGGTVGGYISFSGAHRLLDSGVGGVGSLPTLRRAAGLGILVAGVMRVLLFLAVLGVVSRAGALDPANPAASAFRLGAGEWGYRLFGLILWSAAITSVVGCTYTSLTFFRGSSSRFAWATSRRGPYFFVGVSLAVFLFLQNPVRLLILAGSLNGLILPLTLAVVLLAARRRDLMGEYRHPSLLAMAGWVAFLVSVYAGVISVLELRSL
ncbi:MAG TPA: NRAMP family divalent metal transporter [Vicinamibacteria bacterium]|nr:NRAMP family divalent metal transporter [Vicinamibacteria bacterium]